MARQSEEKAIYNFIDQRWPRHKRSRAYVLDTWERFNQQGLAKGNFVSDLISGEDSKLFQRLWEMVLARHMIEQGFELQSNDPGPDFSFDLDGKKVWIEATAPEPIGLPEKWLKDEGVNRDEQILLRWTNALSVKKKKFSEYRDKGIVQNNDVCVIAITGHLLGDELRGISQLPWVVEAVFPIGPLAVAINKRTNERNAPYTSERWTVRKLNRTDVPTDSFLRQENHYISAVVGCSHCWKGLSRYEMSIVHNPFADNRFPPKQFGADLEYVCESGEDEGYVTIHEI